MKTLILGLFVSLFALAHAHAETAPSTFHLRPFETQTLKNGMTIIWIGDAALPYVSLELMFKAGSAQDPEGKDGLAALTAGMLEKGSKHHSASQISESMEQIGSHIGYDTAVDFTMFSMSALAFHKDEALKMFGEVLLEPTFTNNELERLRKQVIGGLHSLADHPEEFVEYAFPQYLYGKNHPYGHEAVGTIQSLKGLKRNDVVKFYGEDFTPENATMAVVGQYDDAFKVEVVKMFESWKPGKAKLKAIPAFPKFKGHEILLVDRKDLNQSRIQMAGKGVPRDIPDYLRVRAALKVLGESFGSRLFDEIREKRGLTYGISSWFDPREGTGPLGISTFTRVEKTGEIISESLKVYEKFVKDGVTDSEVTEVKALMRGQFARMFETPESLGKQLLILKRYGIATDYLTHNLENVDKMTKADIDETIKRHFDPENMRIMVYAPKAIEADLKKIGPVSIKSYKDYLN